MRMRLPAARLAAGVFAAGYLALLLANVCFFATGPDTSGYLSHARLLSQGRMGATIEPMREAELPSSLAYLFTPYGFAPSPVAGVMVPTYPVGAPLHFAAAAAIGGWERAPFLVPPLAAVGCLLLMFVLARHFGLSTGWRIAGAAILAAMPLFLGNALFAASDVLATFWGLAAIVCAIEARSGSRWAVAAGIAFAVGVAVRPTNVLLAIPFAFAIGMWPKRMLLAVAAALPFAAALMLYHDRMYGSPFTTGYGHAASVVDLRGWPPCLSLQATALVSVMTPFIFPGGLLVVFARRLEVWKRLLLLTWFAAFFLLYAWYWFCPDRSALRFLLPAVPALAIGTLVLLHASVERGGRRPLWRAAAAAVVLVIVAREVVLIGRMRTLRANEWESIFPKTSAWVKENVPPDAVLLSAIVSGSLYYDTGRIPVRWDQLAPETAALLRSKPAFQRPWYAVVSEADGGIDRLRAKVPGEWHEVGRIRDVTFWRANH